VRGFFKKTFFNGTISAQNVFYLKMCITLSSEFALIDFMITDKMKLLEQVGPVIYQFFYPFICITVMVLLGRDKLGDAFITSKIGNMYGGINVTKNNLAIYTMPFWLLRRFVFVAIPVIFKYYQNFQA
jgi:hypothetical protein